MNSMEQDYYVNNIFSRFIEISGEDRDIFLQGIITNDIDKCKNKNDCIYSCFLSPQGKFLADFFVTNFESYYLLEINEKYFESFLTKLKIYKLRSKVEFKENMNLVSFVFFCKNRPPINKNINLYSDPRNVNLGTKAYINKKSNDLEMITHLKELSFDSYREKLMKNLVPNSTTDLIENKSLLLENNFQNINAIDWDKGCYIGQEITARMKYRSLLKKKLYVLQLLTGKINVDDPIIEKNINFGIVVSKIGAYLLCMLKIDLVESKNKNKEIIEITPSTQVKFL
jgi:folate-binding protein YgfZ